ncbi:MAG TPA: flagellar basal body rod protein FlgB, partial [Armatimonadota bacterium]|nr:flagellar basal body rod protein FlgB [Armatimonadota bacterium]
MDLFTDLTHAVLAKVLDGAAARQRAIADNIANADTPGYARKEVGFAEELRLLISQGGPDVPAMRQAVSAVNVTVTEDTASPRGLDGNNVVLEREMAELATNSLRYETTAQLVIMKLRELRTVIRGGGR